MSAARPPRAETLEMDEIGSADEEPAPSRAHVDGLPLDAWAEAAEAAGEPFDADAVEAAYGSPEACPFDRLPDYDAASTRPHTYRVEGAVLVWMVCEIGAYQEAGRVFTVAGGQARALTLEYVSPDGQRASRPLTGWFEFDPDTGEARDHIKYRGIGDCGSFGRYRLTDGHLELLEYRERQCDEPWEGDAPPLISEWPRLFP